MRALPTSLAALVLAGCLVACEGTTPPAPPETASPAPAPPGPPSAPAAAAPASSAAAAPASPDSSASASTAAEGRALPATATFRDLVRAARGAAGQPPSSTSACLLRGGKAGQPATLEAPLEPGIDAAAEPPADLDALLGQRRAQQPFPQDGLRVLTRWGSTEGGDYLDLLALSPASRAMSHTMALALIATDKGIYLGLPGRTGDGRPISADERARIAQEVLLKAKVWVVAAEGDAPVARLREALEIIAQTKGTVVLASPLPDASGPRKRPSRYDHRVNEGEPYACSSAMKAGIPGDKAGEYGMSKLGKLADAFDAATASCGQALGVGAGGAVHVQMRINAQGVVEEACAETDDTGDAALRKCVLEAARRLKLPKPDRAGMVSFGTAAVFTGKPVQPLCDP